MRKGHVSKDSLIETNISEALYFGISAIIKNINYEEKERPCIFTKNNSVLPLLNRLAYVDRSSFDSDSKYEEMKKIQEDNIASFKEKFLENPEETIKTIFTINQKALFHIVVNGNKKYVINKDMKFVYVLEKILCQKKYTKFIQSSFNKIIELYSTLDFLPFSELDIETMDSDTLKKEAYCVRVKCQDVFQQNILLFAILWRNKMINAGMFARLCLAINSWFSSINTESNSTGNLCMLEKEKNILICTLAKYFEILTVNLGIEEEAYKNLTDYVLQKDFVNKHTPTMRFML